MFVLAKIEDSRHGEIGQVQADDQTLQICVAPKAGYEELLQSLHNCTIELGLDQQFHSVFDAFDGRHRSLLTEQLHLLSTGQFDFRLVANSDCLRSYSNLKTARRFETVDRGELSTVPLPDALDRIRSRASL
jgi:hypothetical protein